MSRKVPPFAAMRAFEAAARHGNLQGAATEYGISPSAISHQIKLLEEHLGSKLFVRNNNKLSLTAAGESYQKALSEAFDLMEIATVRALRRRKDRCVCINLFFSLAELWLIPLLARFHELHADIELKLVTQPEEAALAGSDIDIAIRYAKSDVGDPDFEFLFEEEIFPVCSPSYLKASGPITTAADLASQQLLLCSIHPTEWPLWASENEVSLAAANYWLNLDARTFVMQAARMGMGVAMARRPYADSDIEKGHLVAPFKNSLKTGYSYFMVIPERSRSLSQVKVVRQWLLDHRKNQQP